MSVIKKLQINNGGTPTLVDFGATAANISYDNTSSGLTSNNIQDSLDEVIAQNGYAVCSTAGNTAAKTVNITNFKLRAGAKAVIKFDNENTATTPTLNISNTGAKTLLFNGVSAESAIKENSVFLINYNGTSYDLVGGSEIDDSFIGTTAEWEALSSAEKAKYNGKLVYITDDYNPSLENKNFRACYDETTALYAHAIDDIIYVNNHFYIVTSAIDIGDTIAVGTNIITANLPVDSVIGIENLPGGSEEPTVVQKPTVSVGTYTYNGAAQGPTITWATGAEDNCVVTNATKIDAGTYTLTIALKNTQTMVWSDSTTADLTYQYTIAKADQTITLSANSATLDADHLTASVIVSGAQGTISVSSSDSTVATASVSGNTITISSVNDTSGSATITVSVAGTTNYNPATDSTISVIAEFISPAELVIGNTYFFGGFYWTAAEDLGNNSVCLQSQGMTAGTWPAYKLTTDYTGTKSYGSANTGYNGNIDGDNIANYDDVISAWYSKYSVVEKTGASYGSGLFLVSNAKCNQTTSGQQGSGNYWSALKTVATNYSSFEADYDSSWLGTVGSSSSAWFVNSNGNVNVGNNNYQTLSFVIAPAFNLDLTKVKLAGTNNDHILLPDEEMPTLVTWANGTDAQIKAELDAYYDDIISWTDMGWNVGDTRLIHFNSMTAPTPNSGTWDAQDITVVIVAHDHNDLATPINGHTKACITVQTRECMNNIANYNDKTKLIYYNGSGSYVTTFVPWENLYLRSYLNSTVLGAIPAGDFKSGIKPSKHYRHTDYNTANAGLVTDTLFLPSYPEMVGTDPNTYSSYYTPTSPVEGTQFAYYETVSNRIKYGNNAGSSNNVNIFYWLGSPGNTNSDKGFVWENLAMNGTGLAFPDNAEYAMALAPAWAM